MRLQWQWAQRAALFAFLAFGWLLASPARAEAQDAGIDDPLADAAVTELVADDPIAVSEAEAPASAALPIEVTVRGRRDDARALQKSAEAVTVVDLRSARHQSVDLGEVLARTQGVSVRRTGGLGSGALLALNGLQGEQVRVFVDGIPIELSGFAGIANIPVNIVERVEIYRGVVPARFGLDALGGAINVVTKRSGRSSLMGSYQTGSFGIHRLNVSGRHLGSGYMAGGSALLDLARNDFTMSNRRIADAQGRSTIQDVPRFHDGYRAFSGQLEAGVVDRPWARHLVLQGFASAFHKDIQHNAVMSIPFGEVTSRETKYGTSLRYEVPLLPQLDLDLLLSYTYRKTGFRDVGEYYYSWTGERTRSRTTSPGDPVYGEVTGEPIDTEGYQHLFLGRAGLIAHLGAEHVARLYLTPQHAIRRNHSFVASDVNWGETDRFWTFVAGAEHEMSLFDDRLSNIVLAKYYFFQPNTQTAVVREGVEAYLADRERTASAAGAGDSLRYRFTDWLLAKASYEYAVRLPNPDELFGDGVFVLSNTELNPERSHNFNLGPRIEERRMWIGDVVLDVNAFWRETRDQIVLIASDNFAPYRNIADTRTLGLEGAAWWQSPDRWVVLDATGTWLDSRNNSEEGPFAPQAGQRIPSRPYLFASWGARFHMEGLPKRADALDVFYMGRYVHGFWRGWQNLGDPKFKASVPAQTAHAVGLTYFRAFGEARFSFTCEIDNITDAVLYDVYGVQRPGRSANIKITGQL